MILGQLNTDVILNTNGTGDLDIRTGSWPTSANIKLNDGVNGDVVVDTLYGPNGSVEFARWLYVGVTGNVSYRKWDGTDQTLIGLAAGVWHPVFSIMVNSAATTATSLVWGS